MPLMLTSPAFAPGSPIPTEYTCDGADISPPLSWSGVPPETKSLVLIVEDPDAPAGVFRHWAAFDIPAGIGDLAAGYGRDRQAAGFRVARNDFGDRDLPWSLPAAREWDASLSFSPVGDQPADTRPGIVGVGIERIAGRAALCDPAGGDDRHLPALNAAHPPVRRPAPGALAVSGHPSRCSAGKSVLSTAGRAALIRRPKDGTRDGIR